jgi:hypothetical protein
LGGVLGCCGCDKSIVRADALEPRTTATEYCRSEKRSRNAGQTAERQKRRVESDEEMAADKPDRKAAPREAKPQRQANPTATEYSRYEQRRNDDEQTRQKSCTSRDERVAA